MHLSVSGTVGDEQQLLCRPSLRQCRRTAQPCRQHMHRTFASPRPSPSHPLPPDTIQLRGTCRCEPPPPPHDVRNKRATPPPPPPHTHTTNATTIGNRKACVHKSRPVQRQNMVSKRGTRRRSAVQRTGMGHPETMITSSSKPLAAPPPPPHTHTM